MRVLLVEDQTSVARFIKKSLEAECYLVDTAGGKNDALQLGSRNIYDLVLLDMDMAPAESLEMLAEVRQRHEGLPVVVMTSDLRAEEQAQILDAGAECCMVKPFSVSDLTARMRDLLRRRGRSLDSVHRIRDLEIDRVECTVQRGGRRLDLTAKEFSLLSYLACNAGQCITAEMIIENVWNFSFDTTPSMVNVQINQLRHKLDGGFEEKLIRTVRGVGYQLAAAEENNRARQVGSG
jgi:two-component system copper resistance phosphate regulon response regulator CusR